MRLCPTLSLLLCGALYGLPASAANVAEDFWYHSTISSTFVGPISLRAELNYDDARLDAPIAVVMHGYSPTNGNLDGIRAQAQRLRDRGFFAVSVAMRGRDGSQGVRDSGGLEIHDIWDAVESVKAQYGPWVDETNVHITGYSGGGGNVMSAITKMPDYFRVGASFFGMADYGWHVVDGWYNNGAGGRTSILDQDVGDPNLVAPIVLDRYLARASNQVASNSAGVEVHLFVNDDETICPPVNHATFAANGGAHVVNHVGVSASPAYEDFNDNGVEDPGERQLWPHGFPNQNQQDAGEQWYRDRLLAGQIPEPQILPSGTLSVPGFLKTKHFEVWPGNGQDAAGDVTYTLAPMSATFSVDITSSDDSKDIAVVLLTGFLEPAGAPVEASVNGVVVDAFAAGQRRVVYGLHDGDLLEVEVVGEPVGLVPGPVATLALWGIPLVLLGVKRLRSHVTEAPASARH